MNVPTGSLPATGSAPKRRRWWRSQGARILASRLLVVVLALLVWQIISGWTDLVAPVGPTLSTLVDEFRDGSLQAPLWSTVRAAVGGFLLAAAIALPLGVFLGRSTYFRDVFDPMIVGLFSVPRLLIYPVLLAIFGIGVGAKLSLGGLAAFFPMVITTTAAIKSLDPTLTKVARVFGCGRLKAARLIYLPAAAPSIIAALRLGFSVSFVTVVLAEMFVTDEGLGEVIKKAYGLQQVDRMFAVVTLIMVGALAINLAMWGLERRVQRSR